MMNDDVFAWHRTMMPNTPQVCLHTTYVVFHFSYYLAAVPIKKFLLSFHGDENEVAFRQKKMTKKFYFKKIKEHNKICTERNISFSSERAAVRHSHRQIQHQ